MCPEIGKQSVWCPHTAEPHDTALETQVWSLIECENAFNGLKKLHFSLWIECMFRYINIFTQKNCFPPSFMPQLFIEFLLCARNIRQWEKKKSQIWLLPSWTQILSYQRLASGSYPAFHFSLWNSHHPGFYSNNHPVLACMISKLEQLS